VTAISTQLTWRAGRDGTDQARERQRCPACLVHLGFHDDDDHDGGDHDD
jgi:hypothetical protein